MTIDQQSWGYRRDIPFSDIISMDILIKTVSEIICTIVAI